MKCTAFGEILIDFTPGPSPHTYEANPGGAPANLLSALAKWGHETSFIGKVGKDHFGDQLHDTLEEAGIATDHLLMDPKARTTLAFVHLDEAGDRSFTFYRDGGADTKIRREELPPNLFTGEGLFHFGSLGFTHEPARSTQLQLLEEAKEAGWLISYDPNYRDQLWASEEEALTWMKRGMAHADLVKVSEEELALFLPDTDHDEAARQLLETYDLSLLVVTHGAKGSYFFTADQSGYVPGYEVQAIDTTGAGDSFFAGVLHTLITGGHLRKQDDLILRKALAFGNAVGALVTTRYGALLSMPTVEEAKGLQEGTSTT